MNQEIRSKLDRICNILFAGGLSVPTVFVEQISYLIYLKLLDEREAELELKARLDPACCKGPRGCSAGV
jgi:type I restriction enzyme M protein